MPPTTKSLIKVYLRKTRFASELVQILTAFGFALSSSLPVSFLWCISKQCNLPPGEMCSPTMEHNSSCSLIVNHRFSDPGKYCVNVGVMNDVSSTNTSLMVRIPGKGICWTVCFQVKLQGGKIVHDGI